MPYACRASTADDAVKDDFKLRELIKAHNASREGSTSERAAEPLKELLLLTKKELEASLVDVTEDNRKFEDIAVAKVRAVKRSQSSQANVDGSV